MGEPADDPDFTWVLGTARLRACRHGEVVVHQGQAEAPEAPRPEGEEPALAAEGGSPAVPARSSCSTGRPGRRQEPGEAPPVIAREPVVDRGGQLGVL